MASVAMEVICAVVSAPTCLAVSVRRSSDVNAEMSVVAVIVGGIEYSGPGPPGMPTPPI